MLKSLYAPPYVLAPPPLKNKKTSDGDSFGSTTERRWKLNNIKDWHYLDLVLFLYCSLNILKFYFFSGIINCYKSEEKIVLFFHYWSKVKFSLPTIFLYIFCIESIKIYYKSFFTIFFKNSWSLFWIYNLVRSCSSSTVCRMTRSTCWLVCRTIEENLSGQRLLILIYLIGQDGKG